LQRGRLPSMALWKDLDVDSEKAMERRRVRKKQP
jgi:hypothetical protein